MTSDYSSIFTYRAESPTKYKSIFTYNKLSSSLLEDLEKSSPPTEAKFGERLATHLITAASYLLLVLTFPFLGWFCILRIKTWECVVQYRLGRLLGVRGPGRVVTFPWMDRYERCDLRLRSIMVPPVNCVVSDGCVLTAGAEIHYRIVRPLTYVSGVRDPGGHGLRSLAHVVALQVLGKASQKCIRDSELRRFMEIEALERLNEALLLWGIEAETMQWQELQVMLEAQAHNGINTVLQQLGVTPPTTTNTSGGDSSFLKLLMGNTTPATETPTASTTALQNVKLFVDANKATLDSWFGSSYRNGVLEVHVRSLDSTSTVYVQRQGSQVAVSEQPPAETQSERIGTLKVQDSVLQDLINGRTSIFQAYMQGLVVLEKSSTCAIDIPEASTSMNMSSKYPLLEV